MYVKVYAKPDCRKEKIKKESSTVYRIEVKEPAERNLANERLREILAGQFGVGKGAVKLVTGHRSPQKLFAVVLQT